MRKFSYWLYTTLVPCVRNTKVELIGVLWVTRDQVNCINLFKFYSYVITAHHIKRVCFLIWKTFLFNLTSSMRIARYSWLPVRKTNLCQIVCEQSTFDLAKFFVNFTKMCIDSSIGKYLGNCLFDIVFHMYDWQFQILIFFF